MHGGDPIGLDGFGISAEHQTFDRGVVGGDTVDGQVAARSGFGHHGVFCLLHTFQQGQLALVVEIHADTEVDFDRRCISRKLFIQAQNRVAGCHFYGRKKRHRQSLKKGEKAGAGSNSADCVRLSGLATILAVRMCVPDRPFKVGT